MWLPLIDSYDISKTTELFIMHVLVDTILAYEFYYITFWFTIQLKHIQSNMP